MKRLRNLAVGASIAALAATGVGAQGASAATVIKKVICTSGCAGSPFSYGPYYMGSIGVLAGVLHANPSNTYDWTFTIGGANTVDGSFEMQAAVGSPFTPEPIRFTLWTGTPLGAHSLHDTSPTAVGAALSHIALTPGNYFLQLAPADIAVTGEQVDGSISFNMGAVPEPATWLMMMGGLALMGAGLRLRARQTSPSLA